MDLDALGGDLVMLVNALFNHAAGLAQGETRVERAFDALSRFVMLTKSAGIPPPCQRWTCDFADSCSACSDAVDSIMGDFLTIIS
jgi:hypothetical protein